MGFSYTKNQKGGESNALKNGLSIAEKYGRNITKNCCKVVKKRSRDNDS